MTMGVPRWQLMAFSLALFSCHHDPHRPDPAFVASCSTEGAGVLLDGSAVSRVNPHWRSTTQHGGDDPVVRGAEVYLTTTIDPAKLEGALRCHAARVDRKGSLPNKTPLDVSASMPEIVVKAHGTGTVVVIAAESERDGQRVLASAKTLLGQRAAKAEVP